VDAIWGEVVRRGQQMGSPINEIECLFDELTKLTSKLR